MNHATTQAALQELDQLNQQVDKLIERCDRLAFENHALQNKHNELLQERADLMKKNELARRRVEDMISRLKAMESAV